MPPNRTPSPEHLNTLLTRAEREGMDPVIIQRLKAILHFAEHQYSISETCRQFSISRSTFHRWMERFDPEDLSTLADKSHEPLNLRQSAIGPETVELIRRYRMRYPQMGKARIAELLLRDHGMEVSGSSVGRIIERECLFFADTPLHWKKRMEHQRAGFQQTTNEDSSESTVLPEEHISTHIKISPEEQAVSFWSLLRNWQALKRFIVVSSVITNIAFVSILISMAVFERVSTEHAAPQPNIDIEQQEVLHAAPPQVYIP